MNTTEELKCIYNDVSEWLKFLENKNLLFGTAMAIIASISLDLEILKGTWLIGYIYFYIFINICFLVFINIPFLNQSKIVTNGKNKYIEKKKTNVNENPLFYINISSLTENEVKITFKNILRNDNLRDLDRAYITQIKNVSDVASIKAFYYDRLVRLNFILILIFIVLLVIA